MKNALIKIVLCLCIASFVFAADPRLDKRKYSSEKTAQLRELAYYKSVDKKEWNNKRNKMARLIKKRADPNIRKFGDNPLLDDAIRYNDRCFTQLLIDFGVDVKAGERALFAANSVPQVKLLKKNGADIMCQNMFGHNLLHEAAYRNKNPALIAYYCNFIDPNEEDSRGRVPLCRLLLDYYLWRDKNVAERAEINVKILLLAGTDTDKIYRNRKYSRYDDDDGEILLDFIQSRMKDSVEPIADFIARLPLLQGPRKQALQDLLTNTGYLAGIAGLSKIVVDYAGPPGGVSMQEVESLTRETMLLRGQKNKSVKKNGCGCVIS